MTAMVTPRKCSVYCWILLSIGCWMPTTSQGQQLQDVAGAVILHGPTPAYGPCHINRVIGSGCWPSIANNLKKSGSVATCVHTDDVGGVQNFASERISCHFTEDHRRYECHVHLTETEIPIFLGLQLNSMGRIINYTTLHNESRLVMNGNNSRVVVLHLTGYPPLDLQNRSVFPFSVLVNCSQVRGHYHCHVNEVTLLVVKYSCS